MAKISRLKLSGVRSFGPDEIQDIPFQSPVTLILGENGCGKTTIIEALKFACTGQTPSGGKDKSSFVFNPQLKSASITKAVIKAKLIDANGNQILINRGMRVDQISHTTQKFGATDATLTIVDPRGQERTISTRCSDVSKMICDRLGISESILNSVIFCHQEHALWPLGEGKNVKEKFDEIFDSAKYNKCIANINALIKTQRESIKQINEQVCARRDKKDMVERKRAQLHKDEKELEKLEQEIAKKDEEVIPLQKKLQEICEKEETFTALKQQLSSKETEKENLEQNQRDLRKKLKEEFLGSDEELEQEIRIFSEKLKRMPSIEDINTNIEKFNKLIQKSQEKIGQLTAEKEQHRNMIINRNSCINKLSSDLSLNLELAGDSNANIGDAIQTLKVSLSKAKTVIQELENKFSNEENLVQKDIDTTREEVAAINQKINSSNNQIKQIRQKIREVALQLNLLGNSDEELRQLNTKIDKMENDLKKLSSSFNIEETDNLIKINKQEILKMEHELKSLEQDQQILQNNFELENNIDTRLKDIREKENKIHEIKNDRYDEFTIVFDEVPESDIKNKLECVLDTNQKAAQELRKRMEIIKSKITNQETSIKFKEKELSSLEEELESSQRKITNVTKGQAYDELYKKLEKECEFYHTSKGQLSAAKVMYQKFLETFKSSTPCCPVCDTDFKENRSAVASIVNKIKSTIGNIPTQLIETEEKLKKSQELFNRLQQTKPLYERTKTLQENLIPEVKEKLKNLNIEFTETKSERDDLENSLTNPELIIGIGTKIMSHVTLIDKYQNEIEIYKNEVKELKEQMTTIDSEKSRDEVEAEIKVCRLNISEKRQLCDSKQQQLVEFRNQCQNLKEKQHKLLEKRLQLEKTMHGKPQLLEKEKELKGEETIVQDDIKTLTKDLQPTEKKLTDLTNKLKNMKGMHKNELSKKQEGHNKLNTTFQKVTQFQDNIEGFEKKDIDKEYNDQTSKQKQFNQEINALNSQKDMVTSSIIKQRELQDNLEIRSKQIKIIEISNVINKLEAEVEGYDHVNLLRQKHKIQNEYSTLVRETCTLSGKKQQLQATIDDEKKELELPEYKNAYTSYMRKYFELKIKEKSLKDLQIYSKGLENAIIEFHKEKMININSLIREYWRSIYRGNDIDYIQIKTEQSEGKAGFRRSYNYKVIQIKNDAEIEMRGCCSAGQKILACLIIRMALSNVFSHNCGILALDEPTTNLDRENILSLSETLAKMINDRKVERNFQLLVITHDEDFVRTLSQVGSIERCLRVSRDHEGLSVVKLEAIS